MNKDVSICTQINWEYAIIFVRYNAFNSSVVQCSFRHYSSQDTVYIDFFMSS